MDPSRNVTDELRAIARRVMRERGLLPDFSRAVRDEVNAIVRPAPAESASNRDLRKMPWSSIDNDDSRDLDQLTAARTNADGTVTIFVAVADVDALVAAGSAIDAHARANTTSVYTAAEVFSMLPEKLSTNLTSLAEDEDRLAVVVEMTVATDGSIPASDVYRALVHNRAKLAYNGVCAWLEGSGPAPPRLSAVAGLDENLRLQDRIAQILKGLRHRRGALSLETLEARAVFENGALTNLRPDEKNRARELIEDFMIAANGVTARYLAHNGYASLRRVLRSPERWERIVELAEGLGERLPAAPDARALEAFLTRRRAADPERFPDLSLAVVKLMGRGEYAVERPGQALGHFGLAVRDYTHSTAPNRRFPDLITQRLVKAALAKHPSPYSIGELERLAAQCTKQEDAATKVERQVRKSAAALVMESRIGTGFDAIVTGASEKGTWVRVGTPPIEGKLMKGERGLDVGDRVHVRLTRVDVERGFIDFVR
jgi:exoribonuclease-2